ncbi:ArsR/SmtB family transcription factor [Kitasatospora sp. NPDC094028]
MLPPYSKAALAAHPVQRGTTPPRAPVLRKGHCTVLLAEGEELGRRDLTGPFDVSQPTISHHLKVLREAGLVGSERRGTWVYYWVLPAALAKLSALLQAPTGTVSVEAAR